MDSETLKTLQLTRTEAEEARTQAKEARYRAEEDRNRSSRRNSYILVFTIMTIFYLPATLTAVSNGMFPHFTFQLQSN